MPLILATQVASAWSIYALITNKIQAGDTRSLYIFIVLSGMTMMNDEKGRGVFEKKVLGESVIDKKFNSYTSI